MEWTCIVLLRDRLANNVEYAFIQLHSAADVKRFKKRSLDIYDYQGFIEKFTTGESGRDSRSELLKFRDESLEGPQPRRLALCHVEEVKLVVSIAHNAQAPK